VPGEHGEVGVAEAFSGRRDVDGQIVDRGPGSDDRAHHQLGNDQVGVLDGVTVSEEASRPLDPSRRRTEVAAGSVHEAEPEGAPHRGRHVAR
jgi:hypothetical protein